MSAGNNADLAAGCLWAGALLAAVLLTDSVLLRTLLGAPLLLLISGHVVVRGIGVRASSLAEHLAYAVGASVAACIGGGFVLNAIGRMDPPGWAVWTCAVTGVAAVAATFRHHAPALPSWPRLPGFRAWPHGAAVGLAVVLVSGAYVLAVWGEARQRQFTFTEFWMLPAGPSGATAALVVGIRSAETEPQLFDVEVSLDGRSIAAFRSLRIAPDETWTREIAIPALTARKKAEARLYRPHDDLIYRRVSAVVAPAT